MVAILLLGGFSAVMTVPDGVDAQGSPLWFGPSDRTDPTAGWAFRVPVVVTNDKDWTLEDHVVTAEIDFGQALVDAGWISQTAGRSERVRGFTLDLESIRVVEYDRGFRDFKEDDPEPVPHVFYPSLFETSMRGQRFDPSTNPAGTLAWRVDGETGPDERRFYYVYFNAEEYGETPAPDFSERAAAAVEAYAGAGPGQVYYGYSNGAPGRANRIDLVPKKDETEAHFYVYEGGQFRLVEPEGNQQNPLQLNLTAFGPELKSYSLPPNKFFKIESDKPIVVSDRGRAYQPRGTGETTFGGGAFAMALESKGADNRGENEWSYGGTYAGTLFRIPLYAPAVHVIATRPGTTEVTTNTLFGGDTFRSTQGCDEDLGSARPFCTLTSTVSSGGVGWVEIETDEPVLVQYAGRGGNAHQIPARSGAPTGTEFTLATRENDMVQVLSESSASAMMYDPLRPSDLIYPPGPAGSTAPAPVAPGCGDGIQLVHENDPFPERRTPYNVLSVDEEGSSTGPLHVYAGGPVDSGAAAFTGNGGRSTYATGPVAVIGHFDETFVTVEQCDPDGTVSEKTFPVSEGYVDLRLADADPETRFRINATKPVAIVSTQYQESYARHLPGRVLNPEVEVRDLEFRGHLVDLSSAERDGVQVFKTTGPDTPVDFDLVTMNLGRWIGEGNLPDTIHISCTPDRDWDVEGCNREITLNSFQKEPFTVSVTPRDAAPGEVGLIKVNATSEGAPGLKVEMRLRVLVEVTYGVDLRFDVEDGPTSMAESIDPGESQTYTIVMKNLGSVADTFEVSPYWLADADTWEGVLKHGEDSRGIDASAGDVFRVDLEPDETTTLTLTVTAPTETDLVVPPDLKVRATSVSDQSAVAEVTSATRIRADIRFELSIDARTQLGMPGMPTNFTLTLENQGNDVTRIEILTEGVLPEGWTHEVLADGQPVRTINIGPNSRANATLRVVPAGDALAGTLGTLRVAAETTAGKETRRDEESASVVVRQVHDVRVPDLAEVTATPGSVLQYQLDLENRGNGPESVELLTRTVMPQWDLAAPGGEVLEIPRNELGVADLDLTIPEATPAGLYDVSFQIRLSRTETQNITIPVRVPEVRQLAFDQPVTARVTPGQAWTFPLNVRNTGNVADVGRVDVDAPPGWNVTVDPAVIDLAPGASDRVDLVVNASRDAVDGAYDLTFRATFDTGETSESEGTTTVGRPALRVDSVKELNPPRRGDTFIVSARVGNDGDMAAKDVRVGLQVNGEFVDYVTLNRIASGEEKVTVLSWDVDARVSDVKVVVNPESTVVDATPGEAKEAVVQFSRAFPIPSPPALLAMLAVGIVALLARRWRS